VCCCQKLERGEYLGYQICKSVMLLLLAVERNQLKIIGQIRWSHTLSLPFVVETVSRLVATPSLLGIDQDLCVLH